MSDSPLQQLLSHLDRQNPSSVTDPEAPSCTTVEGTGAEGETFWLQLQARQINFQHLDTPPKDQVLGDILDEANPPDDVQLEPASHVCFDVSRMEASVLHTLLERLFSDYFQLEASGTIRINTASLQ